MHFPTIAEVAQALREINGTVECDEGEGCDVRLQVCQDGHWQVWWGDAQYDTDHTGFWGSGIVPGCVDGVEVEFDAEEYAHDLIEQAKNARAEWEAACDYGLMAE